MAFSLKLSVWLPPGLAVLLRSSYIYCSQRGAHTNQTNAPAFLFTRNSLVCSARPCYTPANLCDVMEAGTSNASWWGQMWHLYVIDKLLLSLRNKHGDFKINYAHLESESEITHAFLKRALCRSWAWWLDLLVLCLKTTSHFSVNVTLIPAGCKIKKNTRADGQILSCSVLTLALPYAGRSRY